MRLSILALAVLAWLGGNGCAPAPAHSTSYPSPDGKLTLVAFTDPGTNGQDAGLVTFEIRDAAGEVVHKENTRASHRMRWSIGWLSNDRIELKSSDIGTYYWSLRPDGTWAKESYSETQPGK